MLWGEEANIRQAILRLEDLNKIVQPEKWAKNPAVDGRRENRRELKEHEEEQAARVQLFALAQQYPYEVRTEHVFVPLCNMLNTISIPSSGRKAK
jgi:hypothetical protein